MQEFNHYGQNNLFKIIHHKSKLDNYVKMSFLRLGKGEIEIFYQNLENKDIIPEKTLVFQVLNEAGEIIHLYLLSRLQVIEQRLEFIKYKIGHANLYYTLEDDNLYFKDLSND